MISPPVRRWIGALLILGAVAMLALSIGRLLSGPPETAVEERGPITARSVSPRFTGYHKGVRQWSLAAEEVEEVLQGGEEGIVRLRSITEGILYKDGRPDLEFEAAAGVWNRESGDLELSGGVRVRGGDGLTFTSDQVIWEARQEQLIAPAPVRLLFRDQTVEAERLEADVSEDRVRLIGRVVWTTEGGLRVEAAEAVYTGNGESLEFRGLLGPARFVMEEDAG